MLTKEIAPRGQETVSKILIPFASTEFPERALASALELARRDRAGLVLLRVRDTAESTASATEEELLYTQLKGLQAGLRDCPVPFSIDTIWGPMAESIVTYASRHQIDLIVMAETDEEADADELAENVSLRSGCNTLIA